MRRSLLLSLVALPILAGCSALGLFGGSALTMLEVAGRYEFTEFTLDPVSDAVRDARLLGDQVSDDLTLLLREDGTVSLQRLRGERVDETVASGTYAISGRDVRVRFDSDRQLDDLYLPRDITFEGGDRQLRAEIFREGVNMEEISSDYRGLTRADATLRIRLREIG